MAVVKRREAMSRFTGIINLSSNNEKIYDNFVVKGIKNSDKIVIS